ncbi:hypothetical protein Tco_1021750, partial [Tanacetum coccineum]
MSGDHCFLGGGKDGVEVIAGDQTIQTDMVLCIGSRRNWALAERESTYASFVPQCLHDNMWDDGNSLKLLWPGISLLTKMKISSMASAYDKCWELTIEDNQVKPRNGDLANEYQHQYNAGFMADQGPENWAREFANEHVHHGSVDSSVTPPQMKKIIYSDVESVTHQNKYCYCFSVHVPATSGGSEWSDDMGSGFYMCMVCLRSGRKDGQPRSTHGELKQGCLVTLLLAHDTKMVSIGNGEEKHRGYASSFVTDYKGVSSLYMDIGDCQWPCEIPKRDFGMGNVLKDILRISKSITINALQ